MKKLLSLLVLLTAAMPLALNAMNNQQARAAYLQTLQNAPVRQRQYAQPANNVNLNRNLFPDTVSVKVPSTPERHN